MAHAAVELARGRLEEAAAQLALAESHVQSAPPARRRRLAVAIASSRLALARRSGRFAEVMEQVKLLDASTADESSDHEGSELRGVALMNLGIVETWFDDSTMPSGTSPKAPRSPGDRPTLPRGRVSGSPKFPTKMVSLATARERGRQAVALAERYGLGDRPILAPALGAVACWAIWMGEFDEGERAAPRLGGRRATS